MKITRNLAAAGVAGALALGVAVVAAPVASAAVAAVDDATGSQGSSRLEAIAEALAGLVADGSITQEQADEVAATLDASDALRGPGHHGGFGLGLDAAAEALGLTDAELRTALAVEGTSLADVAAAQGVPTATLVDALVAAATEHLTEAVTDGRITQEQADEKIAALPERIATLVEEEPALRGGHHGRGGHGPWGAPDELPAPTESGTTDGTTEGTALTT